MTLQHRLNMEFDLQSLFGLHLYSCTHWLRPLFSHLGSYTSALLVSQDRRHLFVTPCSTVSKAELFPQRCNGNPIYVFLFYELRGLSPNFHIHVHVSNLYISRIGPHIWLQQHTVDRPILEIYKSLTDI
jgi:hypothetical protein